MTALNTAQVQSLIPHREPFLFVQSAQVLSETKIQGFAKWPASNPILQGHFPNFPVVPGVCQIEACAQLAGVLIAWNGRQMLGAERNNVVGAIHDKPIGVLGAIRKAKFRNLLIPDRLLFITCELRTINGSLFLTNATAQCEELSVMTCEFVIALRT